MSVDDAVELCSAHRGQAPLWDDRYRWLRLSAEQAQTEKEAALQAAMTALAPVLARISAPFRAWASTAVVIPLPVRYSDRTLALTPRGSTVALSGIATIEATEAGYKVGAAWCGMWTRVYYVGRDPEAAARALSKHLLEQPGPRSAPSIAPKGAEVAVA